MRPTCLCLLSLAASITAAAPAWAASPGPVDEGLAAGIERLARESAARSDLKKARVEVEVGRLDPRLQLAPCQRIEPFLPAGLPAWGRTRIGIKCTQGPKAWSVTLPVTVKVWARSLVLTSALPAGTVLDGSHLMSAEVDLAAAPGAVIDQSAMALGRSLGRPLPAGSALRQADLKPRQWFAAGDTVRVVVAGSGWNIVSEGQAMGPGTEGTQTRVRMDSGRMVEARPVADREVEIRL